MNCFRNYTLRNYSDISYYNISHYPNFHILYAVGGKNLYGNIKESEKRNSSLSDNRRLCDT